MRSEAARCLYGFSSAPISATVSVISSTGEPSVATTSIGEKDGWLYLTANNFTYSSPTVRVKITQAKPLIKSVTKKKSITCVRGNLKRQVIGANPKCPSGFRKK